MKNILLLVHDDAGQEARIQAALDLTRALGGHLTCLDVIGMPPPMGIGYEVGAAAATLIADEFDREAANRTRLRERLGQEDVSWDWKDATGDLAACVIAAAQLADLIIVNRKLDAFPRPDMRQIASDIVSGAHCPVFAVPDDLERFDPTSPALVAWDGSAPAAAALRAAVPLLALSRSVCLFSAGEADGGALSIEDAASYLSRHGIHAEVRRVPLQGGEPADLLFEHGALISAGWCVLGAYGHSRLREAIVGGVTRTMLSESVVPLFLYR